MQPLLFVSLLALLLTFAPTNQASTTTSLLQRRAAFVARQKASELAAIKAYCDGLDRYFRSNPKATRYYVDALPDEQTSASSEVKTSWYEVKNENEMLDAERAYAHRSISVLIKDGRIVRAELAEPREHSRTADAYYFRQDGTLARVASGFQSNMMAANILRESYYSPTGKLLRSTARCFRIIHTPNGNREKRVTCRLSEMSAEIASHPIPVYQKPANRPGYDALKNR